MLAVIPVRDEVRFRWNSLIPFPIVTWALLIANMAVFFKMMGMSESETVTFFHTYGLQPNELGHSWLPIFTSMFLHGSLAHLLGNCLFLFIYGDNVEARLGHVRFLLFYILGGAFAAGSHVVANLHSDIPMVGASGAISAVLGAYLLYFPRSNIVMMVWILFLIRLIRVPAPLVLIFWFVGQVTSSLMSSHSPDYANVAWLAHIGGFIFGFLVALLF